MSERNVEIVRVAKAKRPITSIPTITATPSTAVRAIPPISAIVMLDPPNPGHHDIRMG